MEDLGIDFSLQRLSQTNAKNKLSEPIGWSLLLHSQNGQFSLTGNEVGGIDGVKTP